MIWGLGVLDLTSGFMGEYIERYLTFLKNSLWREGLGEDHMSHKAINPL